METNQTPESEDFDADDTLVLKDIPILARLLFEVGSLTLSGDETHSSFRCLQKLLADSAKPRDYDFQDENHHQQEFLRFLTHMTTPSPYARLNAEEDYLPKIKAGEEISFKSYKKCDNCEQNFTVAITIPNIHFSCSEACEVGDVTFDIAFPTGVVVFDDNPDRFGEAYELKVLPDTTGITLESTKGINTITRRWAESNIVRVFVGNTSPRIWKDADDNLQIGGRHDEDEYLKDFENMGYICTDLWWTTMLDKSTYDAIIAKLPVERDPRYYEKDIKTFNIRPGTYRFTIPDPGLVEDFDDVPYYFRGKFLHD